MYMKINGQVVRSNCHPGFSFHRITLFKYLSYIVFIGTFTYQQSSYTTRNAHIIMKYAVSLLK